jgi:small-conductance mechanosensitive channel
MRALAPSPVATPAASPAGSRRSAPPTSLRARPTIASAHRATTGALPRAVSSRPRRLVSSRGDPSRTTSARAIAGGPKGVGESFEKFGRNLVNDLAIGGRLPREAAQQRRSDAEDGATDGDDGGDPAGTADPFVDDAPSSPLKIPSVDRSKLMRFAPAMALAAFAALAAHLYFTVCTETSAGHGAMRVARKLLFEDAWVDLAVTASVLYFGIAQRFISLTLTSFADFVRPNGVNTLWWISLVCVRSVRHVSAIARNVLVWSFGNQLWSTIPLGIDLITAEKGTVASVSNPQMGLSHVNSLLTSIFDANHDGVVTTTEVQMWFVTKTLRLLWCFVILDLCRWFFTLKAAPTMEELKTRSKNYDHEDFLSQALRRYCGGLRGDPGVSWDVQARSALIDKAMTVTAYILTAYYCLSALGVNMSGLLAVGGVSGIAIGFAAQKLVSNCIGGILIFVTQPFVEGDHVQFATGVVQIDGRVDMVGWHSTRIASIDDGYSYIVPNTDVLGSALKNLSRRQYVPIKVTIPFPTSVDGKDEMQTFVDDVARLVSETVDDFSVRKPSVSTVFDGLTPKVRINAFIDASKDENSCKANDLETQIMRDIVEKLQPAEEEVFAAGVVNNVISAASLNAGVAELQKILLRASKTIKPSDQDTPQGPKEGGESK